MTSQAVEHSPPSAGFLLPADYRAEWDAILPGLLVALEYQNEGTRPEDVYCDLRMGLAALYVCEDGFVIFKVTTSSAGQRELLINWAYSHAHEKVIVKYSDQIDAIARQLGCRAETMVTTRRGYERALPAGWEIKHICWVRTVPSFGE